MPYKVKGKCVHKMNPDGSMGEVVPGGCHDTPEEAQKHARALYANVKDSALAELSMIITKASYEKSAADPNKRMRWRSVNSDSDKDLYEESMSSELFDDFARRIEKKEPIPEIFKSAICEETWCGGMPYLSIAHYKSAGGKNVPGMAERVYRDGDKLKSMGFLNNNSLGLAVWDSLCEDIVKRSNNETFNPVRISIGFLDLEHKHVGQGPEYTFARTDAGQMCPLCSQGVGGKIYRKGQLVHLALTRVPVNPRTEMVADLEEKSMDEIITRKDDARSIIKDLADTLEEKSIADGVLVVRADGTTPAVNVGSEPKPDEDKYDEC